MQTSAFDPIAAALTPLRSTRDARNDGGFEDVLGALLEPAHHAGVDVPAQRDSNFVKPPRGRQRPETADRVDRSEAPADIADSEAPDRASAVPAEAMPEPEPEPEPDTSATAVPDTDDSTDNWAATPETADPSATAFTAETSSTTITTVVANAVATDTAIAAAAVAVAPAIVATGAEAPDTGDGIRLIDAQPTATPISDIAATTSDVAAEPASSSGLAGDELVASTRSGHAPPKSPGQRIAALAPELRGTELASIAADKTLPNAESHAAAGGDGNAMSARGASTATAGGSPWPLVDAGALITAIANRPVANPAAATAIGAQIETASPTSAGAPVVPTMSGAEGQFDLTGDHAGLHLGFGGTGMAGAATAAHAAAGPSQQTFSLRTPVEQVALQVVRAAGQQIDHLQLTLEPADLGRVDIRLEFGPDNRLALAVVADRPETLDLLQRDVRALERALQDAGLKTDPDSLSFNLRGEGRNDRDGTRSPAPAPAAIELDPIEAELQPAQAIQAYRPAASGSLDIRI